MKEPLVCPQLSVLLGGLEWPEVDKAVMVGAAPAPPTFFYGRMGCWWGREVPTGDTQVGPTQLVVQVSFLASGWLLSRVLTNGALPDYWEAQLVPCWPWAGTAEVPKYGETQDSQTFGPYPSRGHLLRPPIQLFLAFPLLGKAPWGSHGVRASFPLMISLSSARSVSLSFPLPSLPLSLSSSQLPLNLANCFLYIFIYLRNDKY